MEARQAMAATGGESNVDAGTWKPSSISGKTMMLDVEAYHAKREIARAAAEKETAARLERLRARRRERIQNLALRYEQALRAAAQHAAVQRRKLNHERLKWHRRRDLTMEEIMRGPPI
eukprot:TRINITY_DN28934_c1_g1_i1.p2 TRINITY_DN28934_c1_g1~~TRINITY_DN28934_c1_g1_i1.p2  ORF type:complete len:118 (-),score=26.60 TRINITY_DN28934_c1_g1_i1:52-405(-)